MSIEQIRPPKGFLRGRELIQESKQIENFKLEHRGLKKTIREGTQEENSGVDEYREELRILLGLERVAPESSYSLGTYEQEADRVLIIKNEGKWRYGYVENNQQYLSPHEALYLIEMNRLRVEFNTVIVSVEQAYHLFLDPTIRNALRYEQYVAYAHLMRTGFLVLRYDFQLDQDTLKLNTSESKSQLDNELIWCNLLKSLNLPFNDDLVKEHEGLFGTISTAIEQSTKHIKDQKSVAYTFDNLNQDIEMNNTNPSRSYYTQRVKCSNKRKLNNSEEPARKIPKRDENHYLDILKAEQIQIRNFVPIDIIRNTPLTNGGRDLEFDVYLPNTNYKKTLLPDYRMIVVKSNEPIPTNREIQQLFMKQFCKLPILLVIVSESMSIHPSIYRM